MSEPTPAAEVAQEESIIQRDLPKEPAKMYEYKTTIIYDDKMNETIVSIQPPRMSPARVMEFLLRDRLRCRNLDKIKGWDTEMLGEIVPNKIIVGEE